MHATRSILLVSATLAPLAGAAEPTAAQKLGKLLGTCEIGLPEDWVVLVDARVAELPRAIIGAGIRGAKLSLPGSVLAALPSAQVIEGLGREVPVV